MQNCIFSTITPVFSVIWPFRNHSNMNIWHLKIYLLLLSMLKTVMLLYIFLETVTHSKEQYLFETEIFLHFCTVTFDQFNVSLLNKTINFIKK